MKASRSPRVQVVVEFLVAKHKLDYPNQELNDVTWQELIQNAAANDEVFNFAWLKLKPFERDYCKRKVYHQTA
jgi:hypothetical protein